MPVKRRRTNENNGQNNQDVAADANGSVVEGTMTTSITAAPPQVLPTGLQGAHSAEEPHNDKPQLASASTCAQPSPAADAAVDESATPLVVFLEAKRRHQDRDSSTALPARVLPSAHGGCRDKTGVSAGLPASPAPPCPPGSLPGWLTAALLPFPLDSLGALSRYLDMHCKRLAARRPLVNEAFLVNPAPTMVILKAIGYLKHAPLLRCVLMHHTLLSRDYALTLRILDVLRRDVTQVSMRLESTLRETFFDVTRVSSDAITKHAILLSSFTIALRRDTQLRLESLKRSGPVPALLIVPSSIRIANFGLFVRGSIPAATAFLGYGGELEEVDAHGSGYRMDVGKGAVVDAHTERCLCSMMNDARNGENNARFKRSRHGIRAVTTRLVADEELFVSYGMSFRREAEGVVANFSRSLAADFAWMAKGPHLPRLDARVASGLVGGKAPPGKKGIDKSPASVGDDDVDDA